jgi:hypothetical protein
MNMRMGLIFGEAKPSIEMMRYSRFPKCRKLSRRSFGKKSYHYKDDALDTTAMRVL